MNRLTIGPEGFVDLRRNPPSEKDRVNGWTPENGEPTPVTVPVEFPPKSADSLPAIQKTTEGLTGPEPPVRVEPAAKPKGLQRINSVNGSESYALVTPKQFEKLGKFEWSGIPSGHLYRRDKKPDGTERIVWLHREAARCFRHDRFVAFLNGDQRLLIPSNLRVMADKEKAKQTTRNGMLNAAGK